MNVQSRSLGRAMSGAAVTWVVEGGVALSGEVEPPSDLTVRALATALAALAEGPGTVLRVGSAAPDAPLIAALVSALLALCLATPCVGEALASFVALGTALVVGMAVSLALLIYEA